VEGLCVVVGVHDARVGDRAAQRLELGSDGPARQRLRGAVPGDSRLLGGVFQDDARAGLHRGVEGLDGDEDVDEAGEGVVAFWGSGVGRGEGGGEERVREIRIKS
jgi:hypothetical protein